MKQGWIVIAVGFVFQFQLGIKAFAYTWDKDAVYLCTDPNLGVGGSITGMVLPKGSELFKSIMDMADIINISPTPSTCSRSVVVSGSSIQSNGKACTFSEKLGSFQVDLAFPDTVVGEIKSVGSAKFIEFDSTKSFAYNSLYDNAPFASGPVKHLCARIVNNQPSGEVIVEYLQNPGRSPQYLRLRQVQ